MQDAASADENRGFFDKMRESLAPYSNPKIVSMLVLGFSSGLPILLVYGVLSARFREAGISRTTIGYLSLIGLFYAFKFLWAPLMDRFRVPGLANLLGQRRAWILVTQIGLIVGLISVGLSDPSVNLAWTAFSAVIVAFFSASQDIVIDGWRIDVAEEDEQADMAAATQLGYRFGLIAAQGGALVFADAFDWTVTYWVMAAFMVVAAFGLLRVVEPGESQWRKDQTSSRALSFTLILALAGFFLSSVILAVMVAGQSSTATEEYQWGINYVQDVAKLYLSGGWTGIIMASFVVFLPTAVFPRQSTELAWALRELVKGVVFLLVLGAVLLAMVEGVRTYGDWGEITASAKVSGGVHAIGGFFLSILHAFFNAVGSIKDAIGDFFGWFLKRGGIYALVLFAASPFIIASILGSSLSKRSEAGALLKNAMLGAFVDYARKYGATAGLLLLMIATYRMTDTTMGVMAKPFYIDHGFTKEQIGWVSGSFGPWILILGAIMAGVSARILGIFKTLVIGEVIMILTNAAFAWLALQPQAVFWQLFVTVSADNIAAGFAGTIFIAYMSSLTSKGFSATQYALFTSFFALYGKLLASNSGALADLVGWEWFFVLTASIGFPALAILGLVYVFRADVPAAERG